MRPVVLALVPRDDHDHAESIIPTLTMEAESDIPIWWTMVEDVEHGVECLTQISRVHEVRLLVTFGKLCSPWMDPEGTPSVSAILWPTQVEPMKIVAFPWMDPKWWDDETVITGGLTIGRVLRADYSAFDIVGRDN